MSSKPHRQTLATPSQIDHDALIAGFIDASGLSERITEKCVNDYRYPAHHFLAWLACNDIALETVDGLVIHRFLQHDCDGCALVESSVRLRPWAKRHTSPQLMHFVRYLEQEEWIATPGDLNENLRLVDDFTDRLRTDGYSSFHHSGLSEDLHWTDCLAPSLPTSATRTDPGGPRTIPSSFVCLLSPRRLLWSTRPVFRQ